MQNAFTGTFAIVFIFLALKLVADWPILRLILKLDPSNQKPFAGSPDLDEDFSEDFLQESA